MSASAAQTGPSQAEPEVSALRASVPCASDVFALADKKAKERYPDGTGATALADLVREAARELGYTSARKPAERAPNPNIGRHNTLALLPPDQREEARRICAERTREGAPGHPPCTDRGFVCYRCQDLAAAAIEARRAETGTGSVHESAVAESETPKEHRPNGGSQ